MIQHSEQQYENISRKMQQVKQTRATVYKKGRVQDNKQRYTSVPLLTEDKNRR